MERLRSATKLVEKTVGESSAQLAANVRIIIISIIIMIIRIIMMIIMENQGETKSVVATSYESGIKELSQEFRNRLQEEMTQVDHHHNHGDDISLMMMTIMMVMIIMRS